MITKKNGIFQGDSGFPLLIELNFSKLIDQLRGEAGKGNVIAETIVDKYDNSDEYKVLRNGIRNPHQIEEERPQIDLLMQALFPLALRDNEIKAASIPFTNILFYKSDRFQRILDDAGSDFELTTRNMNTDNAYIFGCCLILIFHYGFPIDMKRPFLYDIPDAKGRMRHYRIMMNGDFMDIEATDKALPINEDDIAILVDNFDNVALWRQMFPPDSYLFKGFGVSNMFDVTIDEALNDIKTNLINRSEDAYVQFTKNFRKLFGQYDLEVGFTGFRYQTGQFERVPRPNVRSILLGPMESTHYEDGFCTYLVEEVLNNKKVVAISDIERYGKHSNYNQFYQHLKAQGFQSYMCAPLTDEKNVLAIIELASPNKNQLNSINANKLDDVLPMLSVAIQHENEEYRNMLEVIIQEECTSIHPAVAWRFEEEAERFYRTKLSKGAATFREIVFKEVYPLYGQSDIKGSSDARNHAISKDLLEQLVMVENVLHESQTIQKLPIFDELLYRVNQNKAQLNNNLAAGTDQRILDFLRRDVHPVFEYLKVNHTQIDSIVNNYYSQLDQDTLMIYRERKNYDESVTLINKILADELDRRAEEAQQMFPHFFERYKTDGVEYNIYIGQSLTKDRKFSTIFLQNLKIWQLTTMCGLERLFSEIQNNLKTQLDITSLIFAYSQPLSIRYRMDEKQFDVDGAYNARYEIVKKRIDKSFIKGTQERLTQPGTLSIVYTHQSERIEYDKYAEYLQAIGLIEKKIEYIVLEDLQGITGLKAMRYKINYDRNSAMDLQLEEILSTKQN